MPSRPTISVIIPVWNGGDRLRACLDAIAKQTANRGSFELIVVDNGSTDDTRSIIESHTAARLLSEPKPGSYRARNRALGEAQGKFVLFTDADCIPDLNWIEQAVKLAHTPSSIAAYGGRILLFREQNAGSFSSLYEEMTAFNQEVNVQNGYAVTANFLCKRDALTAIGGFNAELLSGGDVDCSRRLTSSGFHIEYAPDLIVSHPTRSNLFDLIKKRRRVVGGRWTLASVGAHSFGTLAKTLFVEAINQSKWMIKSAVTPIEKVAIVSITLSLMIVSQVELLRLASGRPAYRS